MQTLRREVRQEILTILAAGDCDIDATATQLVELFDRLRSAPPASEEWKRICAMHEGREQAEKAMLDRLEAALGITPNGRPEWLTVARFLIEKEKDGQTIEAFAANCKADPYTTPKQHQIAKDPMQIKMLWIHVMDINKPKDYTLGLPEREELPEEEEAPLTAIEKAWQSVLEQLGVDMPKVAFAAFVLGTTPISYQNNIFKVSAENDFIRDWLEQRLTSTVNRLLAGILNNADVEVQFVEARND